MSGVKSNGSSSSRRGWARGGGQRQTKAKLNSDLAKCDYLEWVCIRFVCKYGINH